MINVGPSIVIEIAVCKSSYVFPANHVNLFFYVCPTQETPAQSQAGDKRNVLRKGPLIVMVLKTSDAFEYESSEGKNKMFHALVVTETGFFQVKVLDINLKNQFTNNKVIAISNYFECLGVLEIKEASSVSEAVTQMLQVPSRVIKRANETPKIDDIRRGGSGTSVYGLFTLKKVISYNCLFLFSTNIWN